MATTPSQGDKNMTTTPTYSMEATELILYTENDRGTYFAYLEPMLRAATKHYEKGQGDYEKLLKGFLRVATASAKQYTLEHGSMAEAWNRVFPISVRKEVAQHFAEYFLWEYRAGNKWEILKGNNK
jgi:hypothetical protein